MYAMDINMRIATRYIRYFIIPRFSAIYHIVKISVYAFFTFCWYPMWQFQILGFYVISVFIQGAYVFQYKLHVALIMYIRRTETDKVRQLNCI